MHLPLSGPKLVPSQASPWSITPFGHLGLSMQPDVSSWQFVHFKMPPMNEGISVQFFICPNVVPSQSSPIFMIRSPQVPCTPWQLEVSSWQLLVQFKFPPENVEGL